MQNSRDNLTLINRPMESKPVMETRFVEVEVYDDRTSGMTLMEYWMHESGVSGYISKGSLEYLIHPTILSLQVI